MADGKPGRGSDQFPLRLPDGMRDLLKRAASFSGRSMNAEIVARISQTFRQTPLPDHLIEQIEAIAERDDQAFGAVFESIVTMGISLEEFRDQDVPAADAARILQELSEVSERLAKIEAHLKGLPSDQSDQVNF